MPRSGILEGVDYLTQNWGNIVGALGFLASVGGLIYALLARRAAISAEQAANEARRSLTGIISSIDVERAVALINRVMELHRQGNWDYALALYQDLRRTLSEIAAGVPSEFSHHKNSISLAVPQVTSIANLINSHRYGDDPDQQVDIPGIDDTLNKIQQDLELLQSDMLSPEKPGDN